ncbi:thioredoxin [Xylanivirga thermophila]|uniref:thioredoxin n=1 Tax=Xylanivirga thermophila TaxID=2496273 RepID=UPI00101C473C|nr:thioredoxin [Xylanivirga thermophila]
MASDKLLTLTQNNFDDEVLKSDIPVLVDFWAAWCGPCRMIGPIVEQLAEEYDGKIKVGKVNVDEQNELAAQYRVMSIPTLFIFKDGKIAGQLIGARPKADLEEMIEKVL